MIDSSIRRGVHGVRALCLHERQNAIDSITELTASIPFDLIPEPHRSNVQQYYSTSTDISLSQRTGEKIREQLEEADMLNDQFEESIQYVDTISHYNWMIRTLVSNGHLFGTPPYALRNENFAYRETRAYEPAKGDRIGEIGVGNGAFILMLAMGFEGLEVFANELDSTLMSFLEHATLSRVYQSTSSLTVMAGESKGTNMEGFELDKIIVRNTFHHFSDKEAMLNSIKASLTVGGSLFILERFIAQGNRCEHAMSRKEFLSIMKANGFKRERTTRIGGKYCFEFKIAR